MTVPVEIIVRGTPVAQGSKRVVGAGAGKARAIETNAHRLAPWRSTVSAAAVYAMDGADPISGPVHVSVDFTFARPQHHFGSGRNAERLKPSAPTYRANAPDLDKLLRAVFDGLTGIVFRDDAQVAVVTASKRYGSPAARILVHALKGEPA